MKIFKFGGASVKDANAVSNVAEILQKFPYEKIVIVISAMGKTTNFLEQVVHEYYYQSGDPFRSLNKVRDFHLNILQELFEDKDHPIYEDISNTLVEIEWQIEETPAKGFDFEYDQLVSAGELLSSRIVSAYLNQAGIKNKWLDARDLIRTNNSFRSAKVDWPNTQSGVKQHIQDYLKTDDGCIAITQGFIGITSENFTTTLGREGSDFTASILAYCLDASEVVIWKDVLGVYNADPKYFDDARLIDRLSYYDALELAYYGTSIIHPKTIKPLENKKIPLLVKSFIDPDATGTLINEIQDPNPVPSYIFKKNQMLISIVPEDFSFIIEENLENIFRIFAKHGIKINVMQNTALNFSVSVDQDESRLPVLIAELKEHFKVLFNEHLELLTIRHYDESTLERLVKGRDILLEQKSRNVVQVVLR